MKLTIPMPACVALAALLGAPATRAASFCASTSAQLHAALATAESNGEDDEIRLEEGAAYRSDVVFTYASAEPHALSIRGGWIASCTLRTGLLAFSNLSPESAVPTTRVLDIEAGDGAVLIDALRIVRGNPNDLTRGGGLRVRTAAGDITIDRNIFAVNAAASNGAVYARSDSGDVRARNNLVLENSQLSGAAIALVALDGNVYASGNNVLGNLSSVAGDAAAGLSVAVNAANPGRGAYLSNNVVRDNHANGHPDLEAFGASYRYYNAVDAQWIGGDEPIEVVGEIAQDPRLCLPGDTDCGFTYTPRSDSPLRDAGVNIPHGGALSLDVLGQPRIVGAQVDIGAIENVVAVFANGFE